MSYCDLNDDKGTINFRNILFDEYLSVSERSELRRWEIVAGGWWLLAGCLGEHNTGIFVGMTFSSVRCTLHFLIIRARTNNINKHY
jgi:hypothetical protein